ncbi:hypothetical protein [Streptomyces sp. NBC_01276]|uniref:hypothetical protein n=1 Tax=Streptomyces sp. NBC_01276 TaxID=2903808 RepID=UPI00352EA10B
MTAAQLRPIPGVPQDQVPTHRNPTGAATSPATPWVWVLDGRTRTGAATVHTQACTPRRARSPPTAQPR